MLPATFSIYSSIKNIAEEAHAVRHIFCSLKMQIRQFSVPAVKPFNRFLHDLHRKQRLFCLPTTVTTSPGLNRIISVVLNVLRTFSPRIIFSALGDSCYCPERCLKEMKEFNYFFPLWLPIRSEIYWNLCSIQRC